MKKYLIGLLFSAMVIGFIGCEKRRSVCAKKTHKIEHKKVKKHKTRDDAYVTMRSKGLEGEAKRLEEELMHEIEGL